MLAIVSPELGPNLAKFASGSAKSGGIRARSARLCLTDSAAFVRCLPQFARILLHLALSRPNLGDFGRLDFGHVFSARFGQCPSKLAIVLPFQPTLDPTKIPTSVQATQVSAQLHSYWLRVPGCSITISERRLCKFLVCSLSFFPSPDQLWSKSCEVVRGRADFGRNWADTGGMGRFVQIWGNFDQHRQMQMSPGISQVCSDPAPLSAARMPLACLRPIWAIWARVGATVDRVGPRLATVDRI